MKVSDHTMTIMTGLVLTVVVGMLAQNSESIMATFTGQNRIVLQNDAFTVRAGKPQVLDILLNDQVPPKTELSMIEIVETPECGKLEIDGNKFRFVDSETCSGAVTFTYCHADDEKCTEASVTLQIRPKPSSGPVVASAEEAEAANSADVSAETELASLSPQETDTATAPQVVAPEAQGGQEPTIVVSAPEAIDALPDMPETGMDAAIDGIASETVPSVTASQETVPSAETQPLPAAETTVAAISSNPEATNDADVTVALAEVAPPAKVVPERTCRIDLTAEPAPGGMISVSLNAPCVPDSPVTLRQGGFEFAAVTDAAGQFIGTFPAFASDVVVEAGLPDGIVREVSVSQPEADRYSRVAVLWTGDVDLDLRASEYGAAPGQPGYVWSGDPRDWRQARLKGGGYLQMFGTAAGSAEVYSLPISRRQPPGVVDLSLHVADGSAVCDKDVDLRVLRFEGGSSESSQVRFTMAPCGGTADEYEVMNALTDLRVAAR